jgi:DNA-binding MarR family transcriptional regulator
MHVTAREQTLKSFSSDLNHRTPARSPLPGPSSIGWDEIAFLAEGLAFGQRALRAATRKVTERHDLGPRGAWILNVVSNGGAYPLELASVFCVGRSLITAELTRLTEAGLIDTRPDKDDRRKTELTLTPLGRAASDELRQELSEIIRRRLAGFDAAEVRLAAEVLRAASGEPDSAE